MALVKVEGWGTARRNSDGSWVILDNATHRPERTTEVVVVGTALEIRHPALVAVGAPAVWMDETWRNYAIGPSGGLDRIVCWVSDLNGNRVSPNALPGNGNVWWRYVGFEDDGT